MFNIFAQRRRKMQKEIFFYYITIIMLSILLKAIYIGMRNDFLHPKNLMKTLIYKPYIRVVYIVICVMFVLMGAWYINFLPKVLTENLKYYQNDVMNKVMLCVYLLVNYIAQIWEVNKDKEKKKIRLFIEVGIYSILLIVLCLSRKRNVMIEKGITLGFILYNLENLFYFLPRKKEIIRNNEVNISNDQKSELKPLKRKNGEEYKQEFLKKIKKKNTKILLAYTVIVICVLILVLQVVTKKQFILGFEIYSMCYFLGIFVMLFFNRQKLKKIESQPFENVCCGEGRIINLKEIEYIDCQGEKRLIEYYDKVKVESIGKNVEIVIVDGNIVEVISCKV